MQRNFHDKMAQIRQISKIFFFIKFPDSYDKF
jgi:hypothetical protein